MSFYFIEKVLENDQLLIHMDGWSDAKMTYTVKMSDPDIHPVGYTGQVLKEEKLQKPYSKKNLNKITVSLQFL